MEDALMTSHKRTWVRVPAGGLAAVLLILPSIVTAIVWTTINFYITVFFTASTIAVAYVLPKAKWFFAVITAALVALPPYPNWVYWSSHDGWFFWRGESLRNLNLGANAILFTVAFLLFVVVFWAFGAKASGAKEASRDPR